MTVYRYYFHLQYKQQIRLFKEIGVYPFFAYLCILGIFLFFSIILFSRLEKAPYLYSLMGLGSCSVFSEKQRDEFFSQLFTTKQWNKIRIAESLLLILPFAGFLFIQREWILGGLIIPLATFIPVLRLQKTSSWILPTPFRGLAFESVAGLRKWFILFLLSIRVKTKRTEKRPSAGG